MEVLWQGSTAIGGWSADGSKRPSSLRFNSLAKTYGLNQLRYDVRKLKGHGLMARRWLPYYLHRPKAQGALLSCSSTNAFAVRKAHSRFHHKPDPDHCPKSKPEAAHHKADEAIQDIVEIITAA